MDCLERMTGAAGAPFTMSLQYVQLPGTRAAASLTIKEAHGCTICGGRLIDIAMTPPRVPPKFVPALASADSLQGPPRNHVGLSGT